MRGLTQFLVVGLSISMLAACGPNKRGEDDDLPDAPPPDAPCPTTISGKVFAPNGTLPLYNVTVYIPQTAPGPFTDGVSCTHCSTDLPGGVVTKAISDAEGKFTLENVPPGTDVPVVITTGKWRRQLTVPYVAECVDTPIQDGVFRLPKNRTEGDLPRIAMVTGACDGLACIFSKMGVSASEFGSSSSGPERIIWYNAHGGVSPGTSQPAQTGLWTNLAEMQKFDMVINSCECSEYQTEKTAPDVIRQYADMGGRFFGSHYQYTWMQEKVTQWQGTAAYMDSTIGSSVVSVDTSHPDGMALAKWLSAVGGSTTPGQLMLSTTSQPSETAVNSPTTRWLYDPSYVYYMSFKTPVGVPMEQQCGKVVHAGIHVSESSSVNASFPSGCSTSLTPDEKAMIFLMFDLGSCVDVIF
ncbi:MAG TPA: carboxypeptidase-like regulatory domain-containing protein [Kofleriaceae bacterium]|nr:carboxypeptidase-like regulatory domain-containing protein [Kofleriaceae bacterium]